LKVKVQVYEYHRKIAPTMREKLCKPTLTMHILTYKIHQNWTVFSYFTVSPAISFNNQALQSI